MSKADCQEGVAELRKVRMVSLNVQSIIELTNIFSPVDRTHPAPFILPSLVAHPHHLIPELPGYRISISLRLDLFSFIAGDAHVGASRAGRCRAFAPRKIDKKSAEDLKRSCMPGANHPQSASIVACVHGDNSCQ